MERKMTECARLERTLLDQYDDGNFDNQDPLSLYCRTALQRVDCTDGGAFDDYMMYAGARTGEVY